jgi:hypothetical protein
MSTKIETQPKASTTPAHPASHDCCGGASAAEPASKASKPVDPAAVGRPNPSAAAKAGSCCGGAKSNPTGPKS